ncbi:MAG TPA: hypothetical protein PK754_12415, partial [bacterium]|nr:hypothetical protein [bacterium]
MAKITTNSDKLSRDFERVKAETVKMYAALAQNVFDQMAIDSTGNIRIFGGTTPYLAKVARRAAMVKPPISNKLTSRSGRLVASLNNKTKAGQIEAIRKIEMNGSGVTLTYGTSTPYALIHDKGGTINVSAHQRTSKFSATPIRSDLSTRDTIFKYRFAGNNKRVTSSKNFNKKNNIVSLTYKVKGYSINMPARPYVSKALLELPKK